MRSVFARALRDGRRSLWWWTFGIFWMIGINVLYYPSIKNLEEFNKLLEESGESLKALLGNITSLTSPEGYLNSQVFFLMGPMLLIVDAVVSGSAAVAGEEGRRTLPLVLATPVSRWRFYLGKWAAVATRSLLLTVIMMLLTVSFGALVDIGIGLDKYAAVGISLYALVLCFGSLALALGAAFGNRALAGGVTGAAAVGSYFLFTLAALVGELKDVQKLSPFYHFSSYDPLTNGWQPEHTAILLAVSLAVGLLGGWRFVRRDVVA